MDQIPIEDSFWESFLENVKNSSEIDDISYQGWIEPLFFISIENNILNIGSPNMYIKNWVLSNYKNALLKIAKTVDKNIGTLEIEVFSTSQKNIPLSKDPDSNTPSASDSPLDTDSDKIFEIKLNPNYTFDSFVVGPSNEFAYSSCKRIAMDDSATFNPLFIHGGVGLGKTHLMHSIAWEIKAIYPDKQVVYITAEKFMRLYISIAVINNQPLSFKEMFRSVEVLMIDDFQFISGKESTQIEFFHTLNYLVGQGKQMVLSADRSPLDLDKVEDRIISRLQGGLSVNISETTYELRLGILSAKAKKHQVEVPYDVMEFIAHSITSNVRELEGAFNKVILYHQIMNTPITLNMAMNVLSDILKHSNKVVSVEMIQKKVAEHYNIKLTDLSSAKRDKTTSFARHVAMYIAKQLTPLSLLDIGKKFGKRDHTTVIFSIKKIEEKLKTDQLLENEIRILTNSIQK